MLLASLRRRTSKLNRLGQFVAHFFFDDLKKGNVTRTEVLGIGHERTSQRTGAGSELAHSPRQYIYQNVGIPNLLQCLFAEFGVQISSRVVQRASYCRWGRR